MVFNSTLANQNLPMLTAAATPTVTIGTGFNEVQQLTFSTSPTPSGTFTINYGSLTTANITYDANPATLVSNIQSALDASFGASSIRV